MKGEKGISDDYSLSRLPLSARSSFFTITLVRVGAITTLGQFMLGATSGHAMTFGQAMLATFLGSCGFGRFGSVAIGGGIAISLVGWFAVLNAVFAKSLNYTLGIDVGWAAVIAGIAFTILVSFGFLALRWTAKLAVPLFFLTIGWMMVSLLAGHNITDLIAAAPTGVPLTLGAGATIVAGGYIVGALMTPDISRFCKNGRHVFWVTMICIIVGEFMVNGVAILVAHALNTDDAVTIMIQTAGWLGLFTVLLSTVKSSDVCLYSSSLALANVVEGVTGNKWSRTWLTIALGVVGTVLSTLGILEGFTRFLTLLGTVFPPIAGVMLVDYYVLRTSRSLLDASCAEQALPDAAATPLIGWPAIAAWIVGGLVGLTVAGAFRHLIRYWLPVFSIGEFAFFALESSK